MDGWLHGILDESEGMDEWIEGWMMERWMGRKSILD
jgi:hypothetical protein